MDEIRHIQKASSRQNASHPRSRECKDSSVTLSIILAYLKKECVSQKGDLEGTSREEMRLERSPGQHDPCSPEGPWLASVSSWGAWQTHPWWGARPSGWQSRCQHMGAESEITMNLWFDFLASFPVQIKYTDTCSKWVNALTFWCLAFNFLWVWSLWVNVPKFHELLGTVMSSSVSVRPRPAP